MGIKSAQNWSGTVVNGVLLGEPKVHEDGTFEWDGGVPDGVVDLNGDFQPAGTKDGTPVDKVEFVKLPDVKVPEPVKTEAGTVDTAILYGKEDIVVVGGVLYRCGKDGIPFSATSKDWTQPKTAVVKPVDPKSVDPKAVEPPVKG